MARRPGRPYVPGVRRFHILEQYPRWVRNNSLRASDLRRMREEAEGFDHKPLISVLVPIHNPLREWISWCVDSVMAQAYPNWELCICDDASTRRHVREMLSRHRRIDPRIKVEHLEKNVGISGASNMALSLASGEFVALMDHDDELTPDALFEAAKLLQTEPDADFIYSDEDIIDEGGNPIAPHFKPGWSPDLLLSYNYITHLNVVRRSLVEEIGGFRAGFEGSQDYDLALRATEKAKGIHHIPKVLYHWRNVAGSVGSKNYPHERSKTAISDALERRGVAGAVEDIKINRFRVRREISGEPKVSIVIPTRDNVSFLSRCVESIEQKTDYRNYEILIVDNDSADGRTLEYLSSTPHRVVPFREPFNYSRINNFAARHTAGEHLLFLNDDTEVATEGWLSAMLEHSQREEVGAVGAKLLFPNGRVQHAGTLVGAGQPFAPSIATHSHLFHPAETPGYLDFVHVIRNYSAVTAACMMVRKEVFEGVGGFDEENLPVYYNDVDLCLRIREKDYLVVYTPFAELLHHESASRETPYPTETPYFLERWGETLDRGDPYYNPNFARGDVDHNLRADRLMPRAAMQAEGEGASLSARDSGKNTLVPAQSWGQPGGRQTPNYYPITWR